MCAFCEERTGFDSVVHPLGEHLPQAFSGPPTELSLTAQIDMVYDEEMAREDEEFTTGRRGNRSPKGGK